MQQIQLNIIPFAAPFTTATFAFYNNPNLATEEGYFPIFKYDLEGLLDDKFSVLELLELEKLYTNFQPAQEGAIELEINLTQTTRFANHYYRYLIRQYFVGKVDIMQQNFTSETEVWIHDTQKSNSKYNQYNQFTLKVQHNRVTEGAELVVSYDGTTRVLTSSVLSIENLDTNLYSYIVCKGVLYKFKYRPSHIIAIPEENFPVVNNTLKPHFQIAHDVPPSRNRYPEYQTILQSFYTKYLNTKAFKEIIPLHQNGFIIIDDTKFKRISETSNQLVFGGQAPYNIGTDPKKDFRYKGPYKPIENNNNIRFFFIYYKPERETALQAVFDYFKHGFKGQFSFPNMQQYIKQPFLMDKEDSIAFDKLEDAVTEVTKAVKNINKLPNTTYFAIYINPVSKKSTDKKLNEIYYRIKEILLYESISSQVIKSESIYDKAESEKQLQLWAANNPNDLTIEKLALSLYQTEGIKQKVFNQDFNTYLPHIEIAILAKLGGIPWRLNRTSNKELIIGVGAFYSVTRKTRYVGSAFCFDNEGVFKGFNCFNSKDNISLAGSVREAVHKFILANHKATRLIIHFYKDIGKKELEPIIKTLKSLGLDIPVIIVSINKTESKELIAWDNSNSNRMPYSGTFIKVGFSEYLLFNNTRYDEASKPKKKEYHFPIKISISSTDKEQIKTLDQIELFIDQVYQFSRMYWKSNDQQSLPVTIKYPEMVAEIYPHFKFDNLSDFAKQNLWFL